MEARRPDSDMNLSSKSHQNQPSACGSSAHGLRVSLALQCRCFIPLRVHLGLAKSPALPGPVET